MTKVPNNMWLSVRLGVGNLCYACRRFII